MINLAMPEHTSRPEEGTEDRWDGPTFEPPSPQRREETGAGNIGAGNDENQQQQQHHQQQQQQEQQQHEELQVPREKQPREKETSDLQQRGSKAKTPEPEAPTKAQSSEPRAPPTKTRSSEPKAPPPKAQGSEPKAPPTKPSGSAAGKKGATPASEQQMVRHDGRAAQLAANKMAILRQETAAAGTSAGYVTTRTLSGRSQIGRASCRERV